MAGFERGDYAKLTDLKRQIAEKFVYVSDLEKHKMIEHWEDSSTLLNLRRSGITRFTGDCEEHALVSLEKARELGYHARLVTCYTENGEGHAICEVASDDYQEAYYLDNRQVKLCVRSDLKNYKFVSFSPWNPVPNDPRLWLKYAGRKK